MKPEIIAAMSRIRGWRFALLWVWLLVENPWVRWAIGISIGAKALPPLSLAVKALL